MNANDDIYRRLQKHLAENMPVDFPATESGVEISLLSQLITPDEAEIVLEVSSLPEPAKKIYSRLKNKIPFEKFQETLDALSEKGAIMGPQYYRNIGMGTRYSKVPFIVGMYEFQAGRLTESFEKDARKYIDEKYRAAILTGKTRQMRTIPISRSVRAENYIATYDSARDIISRSGEKFSVIPCICREGADLLKEPCRASGIRETCLLLNDNAAMFAGFRRGRAISKDEALDVINRAEEAGLILQPSNNRNPGFICCCCGCCCGMLVNIKKMPVPAEYFHSNYFSRNNSDLCTGCGKCVKRCQMDAITIENKTAVINSDRCIGCGVCVSVCRESSLSLQNKKEKYIPPKNSFSMYRKMLLDRYGISGLIKMMAKAVSGRKL